jgi:hypothetical protein
LEKISRQTGSSSVLGFHPAAKSGTLGIHSHKKHKKSREGLASPIFVHFCVFCGHCSFALFGGRGSFSA